VHASCGERRKRPSLATVLALTALVLALGGTAVAARATTSGTSVRTAAGPSANNSFFGAGYLGSGGPNVLVGPTTGSAALTRLSFDNYFGNSFGITATLVYQPGDATSCNPSAPRYIGRFTVLPGDTHSVAMASPIFLQPAAPKTVWCLVAYVSIGTAGGYYLPFVSFGGYATNGAITGSFLSTRQIDPNAPPPRAVS